MRQRNTEVHKKIKYDTPIFQAVRRSDFPLQIRSKMAEKGLKNVDLAQRLGVSEANVSRWLRGNQNLSVDTMYLLADAVEEPLVIELGAQQTVRSMDADGYELLPSEALESRASAELEEVTLQEPELQCAKVVRMIDYAALRTPRGASQFQFARARSELGVEFPFERMVS
jgi:transcriptional regulator with XRE-family HTH domain